jgi:hypothetical protein
MRQYFVSENWRVTEIVHARQTLTYSTRALCSSAQSEELRLELFGAQPVYALESLKFDIVLGAIFLVFFQLLGQLIGTMEQRRASPSADDGNDTGLKLCRLARGFRQVRESVGDSFGDANVKVAPDE